MRSNWLTHRCSRLHSRSTRSSSHSSCSGSRRLQPQQDLALFDPLAFLHRHALDDAGHVGGDNLLGGPDSQMIANVIERQFKAANDWPFGSALSFLLMYATFGALALRYLFTLRSKGVDV